MLDPGLGFAKTRRAQLAAAARGSTSCSGSGIPVLVGASRKSFLGKVGREPGAERPPLERDVATAVTTAHAARLGAWCVRVHDVVAAVDALDVAVELGGEAR